MCKAKKALWIGAFLAAAFLPTHLEAEKASIPAGPVASLTVGTTRIDWLPQVDYERLVLTVAGPGDLYIQREFGSGEAPVFSSLDVPGGSLPDGIYAYEMRAVPRQDPELREKLADARETGADSAENKLLRGASLPAGPLVQSGHLWVQGGSFVGKIPLQPGASREGRPEAKPPLRNIAEKTTVPDALRIFPNGDIGLGTLTPGNSLHLMRTNGTAQFLVEEASSTAAQRTLATLKNNGGVQLIMRDTSAFGGAGVEWVWKNSNARAQISDVGDATNEFVLDQSGNLTISGTLTQGSDRYSKRDIMPVKPQEVLDKVLALPIATWNRKTDDPAVRHMGPMAQDFAATFGLGEDDRHIAIMDMAGVSLASIQALHGRMAEVVTEKDAEIAELRRENAQLAERLAALEALIPAIAEVQGKK